jgi:hypothetical protein
MTVLMGQVKKDYWSTDLAICTSVFLPDHEEKPFEAIRQAWHFSATATSHRTGRLLTVRPVHEYFLHEFRSVHSLQRELGG